MLGRYPAHICIKDPLLTQGGPTKFWHNTVDYSEGPITRILHNTGRITRGKEGDHPVLGCVPGTQKGKYGTNSLCVLNLS